MHGYPDDATVALEHRLYGVLGQGERVEVADEEARVDRHGVRGVGDVAVLGRVSPDLRAGRNSHFESVAG